MEPPGQAVCTVYTSRALPEGAGRGFDQFYLPCLEFRQTSPAHDPSLCQVGPATYPEPHRGPLGPMPAATAPMSFAFLSKCIFIVVILGIEPGGTLPLSPFYFLF